MRLLIIYKNIKTTFNIKQHLKAKEPFHQHQTSIKLQYQAIMCQLQNHQQLLAKGLVIRQECIVEEIKESD